MPNERSRPSNSAVIDKEPSCTRKIGRSGYLNKAKRYEACRDYLADSLDDQIRRLIIRTKTMAIEDDDWEAAWDSGVPPSSPNSANKI